MSLQQEVKGHNQSDCSAGQCVSHHGNGVKAAGEASLHSDLSGSTAAGQVSLINYYLSLIFHLLTIQIINPVYSIILFLLLILNFLSLLLPFLFFLVLHSLFLLLPLPRSSLFLQVLKHLGEEVWVSIDPQHVSTQPLNQLQRSLPECITAGLHKERFEGVGDLIAQVGVAQVEASEEGGMELLL